MGEDIDQRENSDMKEPAQIAVDSDQPFAGKSPDLAGTVDQMVKRFNSQFELFRGDFTVHLSSDQIVEACRWLRDEAGFEMLIDETAVDYWPQEKPRFRLIYHLRSISRNEIICLSVGLDGNEPIAPTLFDIFPNADYYERELWDLFGIRFAGHPDLRRILMPHDWVGHPLRKDYPLGYEEPQFTFNYEKIQVRKLNPSS